LCYKIWYNGYRDWSFKREDLPERNEEHKPQASFKIGRDTPEIEGVTVELTSDFVTTAITC